MKSAKFSSLILAGAMGLFAMGAAGAAQYSSLDSQASTVAFGYSQMNVKMNGRFSELKATEFTFDPANPEAAKVVIEVTLASIDAGYAEANGELQKDEWLGTSQHPFASFTSTRVEALGEDKYQVTGDLAIKGVTREVTAPFTFKEEGGNGVFDGSFTFGRGDFSVGEGQWKDFSIVANDIEIQFHVVAKP